MNVSADPRSRPHLTMVTPVADDRTTDGDPRRRLLIEQLPEAHAVARRLADAGFEAETISVALGIAVQGVAGVLEVARAKLRRIEGLPDLRGYAERSKSSAS